MGVIPLAVDGAEDNRGLGGGFGTRDPFRRLIRNATPIATLGAAGKRKVSRPRRADEVIE